MKNNIARAPTFPGNAKRFRTRVRRLIAEFDMSIVRSLLLPVMALVSSVSIAADPILPIAPIRPFLVFDGLLYVGKPDLAKLGMVQIRGVNPPVVDNRSADQVDEPQVRATLQDLKGFDGVIYLDYEQWAVTEISAAQLSINMGKLVHVAQIARETVPSAKFGYYGLLPCFDYWNLVKNDQKKIKRWQECNVELDPLSQHVDVILPSLYTFYNDPQGWDIFAAAQLKAARRYNKPVYAFLWPEFHVSNPLLKGKNLPGNFWRHELEFCRTRADGVVIWGGYQEPWDDKADWWIETKGFLAGLNSHRADSGLRQ
jgi:hypothetical protein